MSDFIPCERCGEKPATHTVEVERTIGGSGDPEADVFVERKLCDECYAELCGS